MQVKKRALSEYSTSTWPTKNIKIVWLANVVLRCSKKCSTHFYTCCRYLKHSLGSGEHNALWFMIVWYFNQDISWQIWPHLTVDIFKSRIKKGRTKNATHFCVFWWICEIFWKLKKSKSSNIGQSNFWWYSDALKCRSGL